MMNTEVYRLVDSHAHLDEIEDIERAILDAKQVGVVALIAVGQDYESNLKVLELSEKYEALYIPRWACTPGAWGTWMLRKSLSICGMLRIISRGWLQSVRLGWTIIRE